MSDHDSSSMICTLTGKVIYSSANDANFKGGRFHQRKHHHQSDNRTKVKLTAHICDHCNGWHLGRAYSNKTKMAKWKNKSAQPKLKGRKNKKMEPDTDDWRAGR